MSEFIPLYAIEDIEKAIPERRSLEDYVDKTIYIHYYEIRDEDIERGFKAGFDLSVSEDKESEQTYLISTSAWQVCAILKHAYSKDVRKMVVKVEKNGKSFRFVEPEEDIPF